MTISYHYYSVQNNRDYQYYHSFVKNLWKCSKRTDAHTENISFYNL